MDDDDNNDVENVRCAVKSPTMDMRVRTSQRQSGVIMQTRGIPKLSQNDFSRENFFFCYLFLNNTL